VYESKNDSDSSSSGALLQAEGADATLAIFDRKRKSLEECQGNRFPEGGNDVMLWLGRGRGRGWGWARFTSASESESNFISWVTFTYTRLSRILLV
jgi:hypothetical protein